MNLQKGNRSWQEELLSTPLGIRWGSLKAVGWSHLMAHSLPYLVTDAGIGWDLSWGCWTNTYTWSVHVAFASFTKWWLSSKGKCPRKREHRKKTLITFYELALGIHSIISTTFYSLRQSQVPPEERESGLHLLMDGQWQVSGRSWGSGNIGMALFGKHILLSILLYIGLSGRLL